MVLPRLGLWFTNYCLWPPAFLASDFIFNLLTFLFSTGFPGGSEGKESASVQETQVQSLNWEDPLGKGMVTYFSIFAWRIPWTDEPGRLQSMGFQRIEHNWITDFFFFYYFQLHIYLIFQSYLLQQTREPFRVLQSKWICLLLFPRFQHSWVG